MQVEEQHNQPPHWLVTYVTNHITKTGNSQDFNESNSGPMNTAASHCLTAFLTNYSTDYSEAAAMS